MSMNNISLRPMRLKVLYTFDEQSKINCLARWPHILNIQTVELDEATSVGVVELKTCIQAVVSASPELVATLGHDYTVYAYDYSEQDTPLVGQGMLSWALASASPASGTSTSPSRAVITGRVCKNILSLFSSGTETLEVKLRLLPVPNCQQNEFIRNMDKYRELSRTMPAGFDAAAWTSFLQANPSLGQAGDNFKAPPSFKAGANNRSDVGMETLSQIMNQGLSPVNIIQSLEESVNQTVSDTNSFTASVCGDISRTASPVTGFVHPGEPYNTLHEQPSRPASQASARTYISPYQDGTISDKQTDTGAEDLRGERSLEEGPVKKRVRTTKTGWNGKVSLGTNSESLRVTASTTASMRGLRPVAGNPSDSKSNSLRELLPRPPTPRPEEPKKRGRPPTRSKLNNAKSQAQQVSSESGIQGRDGPGADVIPPTPVNDDFSYGFAANSPFLMASSPPTFERGMTVPSSPVLPVLPRQVDSGFMSGPVEESRAEDDEMRPIDKEDLEVAAQYSKRSCHPTASQLMIQEVTPGPPELLPTRILPRPINARRKNTSRAPSVAASEPGGLPKVSHSGTMSVTQKLANSDITQHQPRLNAMNGTHLSTDAERPPPPSRDITRTRSIGGLTLPTQTASDPVMPVSTSSHQPPPKNGRRQSITSNQWQNAGTNIAQTGDDRASQPRSGSGAKRRKAIQKRLVTAIETGTMPPFCENCGAIETPTWRKVWSKRLEGSPDNIKIADEEGSVVAIQDVLKDEAGNITSFCILKKSLLMSDKDFKEIQLCNPCGLWFQKTKSMRPEYKWNKDAEKPNEKKKRASRKRKQSGTPIGNAAALTCPEGPNLSSDNATVPQAHENDVNNEVEISTLDDPPSKRTRAANTQLRKSPRSGQTDGDSTSTAAALNRYMQSSPARMLGTQFSPIDVDDLGSTRRILFPSPKKAEGPKPLQDITANPRKPVSDGKAVMSLSPTSSNKENCVPQTSQEDDLAELFEEGDENNVPSTPKKKSPIKTGRKLTPGGKTNHESSPWRFDLSSNNGRDMTLLPRTPSSRNKSPKSAQYSPFTAQMCQLLSEANNGSPTGNNFDFSSLPNLEDLLPMTGAGNTPNRATTTTTTTTCQFTQLCEEDMFSTDIPMPSSPPGMFSLYKDPVEASSDFWNDFDMHGNPQPCETGSKETNQGDAGLGGQEGEENVLDASIVHEEGITNE